MASKRTPVRLIRSLIIIDRERKRKRSRTGVNLLLRILGLAIVAIFLSVGILTGMSVGAAAGAYSIITAGLPTPEEVEQVSVQTFETTKIYAWGPDEDGDGSKDPVLIYEVIDPNAGDRNWIPLSTRLDYVVC